jgi:antitoxin ParD1/3/4
MGELAKRTVSMSAEHAAYIDAKVAAGDYASVSEVVRDGLRALKAHDEAIEAWLRGPVVEAYDELEANPSLGIPIDEAFKLLRRRIGQ